MPRGSAVAAVVEEAGVVEVAAVVEENAGPEVFVERAPKHWLRKTLPVATHMSGVALADCGCMGAAECGGGSEEEEGGGRGTQPAAQAAEGRSEGRELCHGGGSGVLMTPWWHPLVPLMVWAWGLPKLTPPGMPTRLGIWGPSQSAPTVHDGTRRFDAARQRHRHGKAVALARTVAGTGYTVYSRPSSRRHACVPVISVEVQRNTGRDAFYGTRRSRVF